MKSISNTSAMRKRIVAPGRRRMHSMILLTSILLLAEMTIVSALMLDSAPTGVQVTGCDLQSAGYL